MTLRIIPAIMSGGAGTRLWPLSTEDHPKQFHALMGPRTMFAETVARVSGDVAGVSFAPPIVLCGRNHVPRARNALAEVQAKATAIAVEPEARNTAAVAVISAALAREVDASALVLLLPSDHVVANVAAFHDAVRRAAAFAEERIITFGITPNNAATGYGYIKRGAPLGDEVFSVGAFKEKPDLATAESYVSGGDFSWNSGMFLFAPGLLLSEFDSNTTIRDHALASLLTARRQEDEIQLGAGYALAPKLPLDIAVMERTTRAAVVPCDIGWADVGSWSEVARLAVRDSDGFAFLGSAACADISKIIESGVKALAIAGDDLAVVAAPRGLMIVPRSMVANRSELLLTAERL
ncbi:MAG: mannose-1-phosphate guanylyltransferase [Hyphomonadaceae bacterium]